jgi:hypothetical protein
MLSFGASEVGDVAAEAVANRVTFFASGIGKAALMTVKAGLENAVASVGGQLAQNLITEGISRKWSLKGTVSGLGWNALMGFGTGALGGALTAGLGKLSTGEVSATQWAETDESVETGQQYNEMMEGMQEILERRGLEADPAGAPERTFEFKDLDLSKWQELGINALPDALITWAADAALTNIPSWPQW